MAVRLGVEKAVFAGDFHAPYHDMVVLSAFLQFLGWFKPHDVYINGDLTDAYHLSRFEKNPERANQLQNDIDEAASILKSIRRSCPNARIHFALGNHDDRFRRYLWEHPELASLRNLSLSSLLGLDKLGVDEREYGKSYSWHGLMVEHGSKVNKKSAYTAASMLEMRGVSGISNHTHRLGSHYKTDFNGMRVWWENGCMCRLDPEYAMAEVVDWQQGWSVSYAPAGSKRFFLDQIPVIDGKVFYQGYEFCG